MLIGMLAPMARAADRRLAERKVDAFAMELMPRITRAQGDGRAVVAGQPRRLQGGDRGGRRVTAARMPMMMTAAGTIAAAQACS